MSISKAFVPVFFGAGYDKVVVLINVISPILILMGMGNVLGTQYLLPTKKQKEYTISVTIGLGVNFLLNYFLIKKYASIGASIATVLSELVIVILQFQYIKKDISFKNLLEMAWKYFISGLVMAIACFGVRVLLNTNLINSLFVNFADSIGMAKENLFNITSIIIQMGLGILVYFGMLIILKDDYVFKFIDKVKSKIFKKKETIEENG